MFHGGSLGHSLSPWGQLKRKENYKFFNINVNFHLVLRINKNKNGLIGGELKEMGCSGRKGG